MPRKTVAIDYQRCKPGKCEKGVCKAAYVCEKKLLTQPEPFEMPDARADLCQGCARCVVACPTNAVRVI